MATQKLKIGFVLDDGLDRPDGVQQFVLTSGEWLAKQGHEVHYLVGQTARTDVPNIHSLASNITVRFNDNQLSIPRPVARQKITECLAKLDLDVLHVQMPYSPFFGGRVIEAAHDEAVVGSFHILPAHSLAKVGNRALGYFQRHSLGRFDAVTATSVPAQLYARQNYGVDATVVPNPIDLTKFKTRHTRSGSGNLRVVFLGRLVRRKGCGQLLEAISLMPEDFRKGLRVIIGGTGPLEYQLVRQAEHLNIKDQVFFQGFIEEADKAAFLAQADVAVFPSLGGESFGIILLEAMAAGAGVVMAGDNPGYHSVLGSIPGSLFDPYKPRQMAEALEFMLRSSERRRQVHRQQQAQVKQYDIDVVGPKLLSIYQQAIAKRPQTKA